MVGAHGVHGSQQLQRTYRSRDEFGARDGPELFMETTNKHKEFHQGRLVGVDDSLGYILWACYFMQEQGYGMKVLLHLETHAFPDAAYIPWLLREQRRKSSQLWTRQYVRYQMSLSKPHS